MYYNSSKGLLYQYVEHIRANFGINYSNYPINAIALCKAQHNIIVESHPFKTVGLCGMAMLGEKMNTIILNASRSEREQNFDCGHEFLHTSKHRKFGEECFKCFTSPKPEQDPLIEWEANEGSAELLVPYKLFLPKIKSAYSGIRSKGDLKRLQAELALDFDVSMAVICFRLESLKLEIAQLNSGIPLAEVILMSQNEQKKRGLCVRSLNDIFGTAS